MEGNNSVRRNVITVSDLSTSMSGIECVPISGRSKFILKKSRIIIFDSGECTNMHTIMGIIRTKINVIDNQTKTKK